MVDPDAIISMRETLTEMYGLEGSTLQQYFAFLGSTASRRFGPISVVFPHAGDSAPYEGNAMDVWPADDVYYDLVDYREFIGGNVDLL